MNSWVGSLLVAFTINIFTIKKYFHKLYFSRLTVLQKGKLTKKKKKTQKPLLLGTEKKHTSKQFKVYTYKSK